MLFNKPSPGLIEDDLFFKNPPVVLLLKKFTRGTSALFFAVTNSQHCRSVARHSLRGENSGEKLETTSSFLRTMPLSREARAKHAARQRTEANAKRGDINAQFNLALRYLCGEGCEVNSSKARDWFEKAANQGDADAQFNLGIMLNEDGDAAAAKRWFQEAAAQGNAVGRRWNVKPQ